jgi:preprotein translocase subunit SecY
VNLLASFVSAFKIPDLRRKILFTLLIIGIYRFGAHIPTPGIDVEAAQRFAASATGGVYAFINLFSGGALTQMAIFALGIMPYITSSIIMQLLTAVIPRLEAWSKEGESGYKKINQWTRYLTVLLALLQSTGLAFLAHSGQFQDTQGRGVDLIPNFSGPRVALVVLSLTAGTALIMWLGELITQRGIGNGMSILIFASIVSTMPSEGAAILAARGWGLFSIVCAIGLVVIVAIVIMEQGQRRIPVQYAKRVVGRKMMGGQSVYIPLKVNQAGVIPIIFASSVLYIPTLLQNVIGLRRPGRVLRLLLHGDLVQSGRAGGKHQEIRRLYSGSAAGPSNGRETRLHPHAHYVAGSLIHCRDRAAPIDLSRDARHSTASVRRDVNTHYGRCHARDDEAD